MTKLAKAAPVGPMINEPFWSDVLAKESRQRLSADMVGWNGLSVESDVIVTGSRLHTDRLA